MAALIYNTDSQSTICALDVPAGKKHDMLSYYMAMSEYLF